MPRYLRDKAETIERLRELRHSLAFAEYELAAGVELAKNLGLSWTEVAGALEVGSKAAASQWAKRHPVNLFHSGIEEQDRIAKLIGAGEKVSRWEVRVIVEGREGVTAVRREMLSRHLRRDVAEDRARKRGPEAEVWRVDPDGTDERMEIRSKARAAAVNHTHPDDEEF